MLKIVILVACLSVCSGMILPKAKCEAPAVNCGDYNCYSESTHVCLTLEDGGHRPCPIGNTLCGSSCFNPASKQVCHTSNSAFQSFQICEEGEEICGLADICYNPETHACLRNKSYGASYVCPIGEHQCGYWGCYKAHEQKCDEEGEGITAI